MSLDKIINYIIEAARKEEQKEKIYLPTNFRVFRVAGDLIQPLRKRGEHHRTREKFYTSQLEESEKELRAKGISVEVWDQNAGYFTPSGSVCSGSITGSNQQFQPKIDQKLLDVVKHNKAKMLEHRAKAENFEKLSKAFGCAPATQVELTVEDIFNYQLEK